MAEQLFASFILDRDLGLEIAIAAEDVTEATAITEKIQPLPASVDFLEGIMHLRDAVIPILNLKKRIGLQGSTEYNKDAKIAVVTLGNQKFGLLFDDIREVLRVDDSLLLPIQPALQSEDYIISSLITLQDQRRTIEVLDLKRLFEESAFLTDQQAPSTSESQASITRTYSRYVIFTSGNREYGVPVENSRELTFLTEIDDTFKTGHLEGALQLRGHTVPVMSAGTLLHGGNAEEEPGESSRILVMATDAINFGMIIDEILEILTVCNEEVLPMPASDDKSVSGIYEPSTGRNIILLNVESLVASQMKLLESIARIKSEDDETEETVISESRHLITENCYLIFSIGKYFAIELKDVQELIEDEYLMSLPGATGFDSKVLNLRGKVIPVVNLRSFYDYPERPEGEHSRLIICGTADRVVALQVDAIITIYKQEEFHETPSLNPQLQNKRDTLDRLIEFIGEKGIMEHLLVINTHNLINNYLPQEEAVADQDIKTQNVEDKTNSVTEPEEGR